MFFDEAKIYVKAGDGGDGVIAFRREKYVPRGGPAGGHGGKGGDVILEADPHLNTLIHFKKRSHFKAERGEHGGGKNMAGAMGGDTVIPVPLGTVARHAETGVLLADLVEPGQRVVVAQGGRGGRGNTSFKSSTNQAPKIAERGLPGEALWITLELKLIADVGVIGVPNAGKSTLLSVVSAARPKIADYPFTTLQPNLGVVELDNRDLVMADIPGLIEGAHEGAGLGHQFLRHIERSRLLVHLLNGAAPDPLADFEQINEELQLFSPKLAEKPQIVVLNKIDLPEAQAHWPAVQARAKELGLEAMQISAVTGQGVPALLAKLFERLDQLPREQLLAEEIPVFTLGQDPSFFEIEKLPQGWRVSGPKIEQLARQTYWDTDEGVMRVYRILEKMGVHQALQEAGVEPGDTVFLDNVELEWVW
ncbi:MAG TPA: GTPase ObgE [Anaerolineae bacterium]|nr:GTPase ObgE [Anaerolineae bacterium]